MRRATDSHRPPVSEKKEAPQKRRLNLSCLFPLYVCIALGWLASVRLRPAKRVPTGDPAVRQRARAAGCLSSLDDLSEAESRPIKGTRHMVQPPPSSIALVCCRTTKGPLSIAIRPRWAPRGARRFYDMVSANYFSARVPLFRCIKNFLCQWGIAGREHTPHEFMKSFEDDPSWLPWGPKYWSIEGVARFAQGYLAYAGGGKNSRGNQFILGLVPNQRLCGGSPWEVPWGEIVGSRSFATLSQIYTGYGDAGPTQGYLHSHGADEALARKFPLLDYVDSCDVVDDGTSQEDWAPYPEGFVHATFATSSS